jgi:type I restriction enzyme S subunit
MLLSVPRDTLDESCCLDVRRYQEVSVVIPAGFETISLGNLFEVKGGKAISKVNLTGTLYPYYGCNGINGYVDEFLYDGEYIVCAQDGSIGSIYLLNEKFYPSNHTHILKTKNKTKIINSYGAYFLKMMVDWKSLTTSVIPKVTQSNLLEIKIIVPPLSIQQEIVTALDLIYVNATTAKAAAASVKSQMAAVVRSVGARGFERKKLGDLCSFVNGYAFKSEEFIETGVPVLKIKNIKNNLINLDNADYCLENNKLSSFIVKENDIIISLTGELSGDVGINCTKKECYLNQRTARIDVTSEAVNHKYMYYYMVYSDFVHNVRELSTGSAQPNVSTKKIEELNIPLPPLPIQHEVLAILNEMEAELAMLQQMAANAEQRAKFILDGYLSPAE